MSLTIQQLLADAKTLQSRLSDDETKLNGLVSDAQTVYSTIESMREVSSSHPYIHAAMQAMQQDIKI
jgi:hypothetical protein